MRVGSRTLIEEGVMGCMMHPYAQFVNPVLGGLLHMIRMDKRFVRGEGAWLWDDEGVRYLDFIASYGALPFGYNPPQIWDALQQSRETGEPSFVQPSYLNPAGELARRLIELTDGALHYVTFTNSGTEATEAALKLARAHTGRRRILATNNSFHGKTLGALSTTGRSSYQDAFGVPFEGFDFVPYGDAEVIAEALRARPDEYAAVLLEPIQGEGGIVMPPAGYLKQVKELCREHGALFMLDEVQTGLGRTGTMFRYETEGVTPDVMMLAKALGGGMLPVGAMLCTAEVYTEEFGMKHSSTFAGNTLGARAGLATLDVLTKDNGALLQHVQRVGTYLQERLEQLKGRFPRAIRGIRGTGLMLGIDIGIDRDTFGSGPGSMMGIMAEQELLTPAVASYLLNNHGLRVAPTLNGNSVIRIEPPLNVTEEQCDLALEALADVFEVLETGNTGQLLAHLVGRTEPVPVVEPMPQDLLPKAELDPDADEGRFAFLVHPLDMGNYPEFDRSLAAYTDEEMARLSARFNAMIAPFVVGSTRFVSAEGKRVYGEFIAVPRTTDELITGTREDGVGMVRAAVELGRARGAQIVGLGAYTAIVSRSGRALRGRDVALTTGNSYTVVAAIEALLESAERMGEDLAEMTAAVVGAAGSIGRGTSLLLAPDVRELVLVGNPRSGERGIERLTRVAGEVFQSLQAEAAEGRRFADGTIGHWLSQQPDVPAHDADLDAFAAFAQKLVQRDDCPIRLTNDTDSALRSAHMVVIATSSAEEFITPDMLRHGAVICDMSRPPNVSRQVDELRPDVLVLDGGVIEVPERPWFGWDFGYEQGLAYACMSETMILALEREYQDTSLGSDLTPESMLRLRDLAEKHGFRLAGLRSFDRPVDPERWERLLAARSEASIGAPS